MNKIYYITSVLFLLLTTESPEFKDKPVLSINEGNNGTSNVFICKFARLDEDGLIYTVEWTINNDIIKSEKLASLVYEHELMEKDIRQLNFRDQV